MTHDELKKILDELDEQWGEPKKYCRFCNLKAVVKGECQNCGAGSYVMPDADFQDAD